MERGRECGCAYTLRFDAWLSNSMYHAVSIVAASATPALKVFILIDELYTDRGICSHLRELHLRVYECIHHQRILSIKGQTSVVLKHIS